jgi:hyperosmotically inducible periplasmic protein
MKHRIIAVSFVFAVAAFAPQVRAGDYAPDNTGANTRDRSGSTLTAGDQSNSTQDLAITQEVRKAIVADEKLSTNAHNVKVITDGGVVTLRGPVNSSAEKAKVMAAAEQVAGVKRVDNQLEVTNQ